MEAWQRPILPICRAAFDSKLSYEGATVVLEIRYPVRQRPV